MPQIYHKFNGGIVNDPRSTQEDVFRMVTNFDVFTNPKKATPYRDSESGDSAGSTSKKQKFEIAYWGSGADYRLFSLGVVSGTGRAEVLMKTLTTGGSTDLSDNGWATPANNQSSAGSTSFNLFKYYKKTGLIYGARAGTAIWAFDAQTAGAWADTSHSLTYTNIAQAVVHSKDDIMYLPYDNKIATNNNGSWNDTALTLPSHFYITSICEHGNFLAIACAPLSGIGESRVYLWDRDSSLTTLTENISWGMETLKVIEDIEGFLVGISVSGGSSTRFSNRVSFKYMLNGGAHQFDEFTSTTAISILIEKQMINNRLYFMMNPTINGTKREGVWSIGLSTSPSKPFSIVHERTPDNDTAIGTLKGFFIVGDFFFISYVTSGAVDALSKTNDSASYTASSVLETVINFKMPDEDKAKKKKIGSVICTYEPLPTAGSVTLKYKVDGGSYITVFTETTDGAVVTERTKTAANGFMTDGREYEFQLISTGGAEITGIGYDYSVLKTHTK